MISKILAFLGNPADVRTAAAIVIGILMTIFHPGNSDVITAVVDGVAGIVVVVDQALVHKRQPPPATPPSS